MEPIPLADSDTWNNATGNSRGAPVMIRYRPGLERFLGDPRYPRRLTISWDFGEANTDGLPSEDLSDQMREFEDLLQSRLDPDGVAILAFVHTRAGVRRWNYYISDVERVGTEINEALSVLPKLPIQIDVEQDVEWSEMQLLLKQCR